MGCLLLLALGLAVGQAAPATLTLEIRVFLGGDEVTSETRVTVHRAGDRSAAIETSGRKDGGHLFVVPAGIYDAQVVREREGRVLNIRWAERLIVMPYPDEGGRHLEVVNFTNGYGALQVRTSRPEGLPDTALFPAGEHARPAGAPVATPGDGGYALFVVPAGRYDLQVKQAPKSAWHTDLDVPLDRTRLRVIP